MPLVEPFKFQSIEQASGSIVIGEGERNVPFPIRRVYFLHGLNKGVRRGFHAHRDLVQIAVCAHGSCMFHLDDGAQTAEVQLDQPAVGLIVRPMIWHEMYDFSANCVLLLLASKHYDEEDYLRSYEDFKIVANR